MNKHTVFYLSIDSLINTYIKGHKLDYTHLGVDIYNKIALCSILFDKSFQKNNVHKSNIIVDKSSLKLERIKVIDYIIEDIIITKYQLGLAQSTIFNNVKDIIFFVEWSIRENINFLFSVQNARKSLVLYTQYLKELNRLNKLVAGTSRVKQLSVIKMLASIYNDKKGLIYSTIDSINVYKQKNNGLEKSKDTEIDYAVKFYTQMFNQIYMFIINKENYPKHIKICNKEYCLLPFHSRFPFLLSKENEGSLKAYDFDKQYIRTGKEISEIFKCTVKNGNYYRYKFIKNIKLKNQDMYCDTRLYLGSIGMKSFYIIFLNITGMNDSNAATLLWNDKYSIDNNQKFKSIKYRAKNKHVEFQIQKNFMPLFKKFLELRKYVLNGSSSDYLFFTGYGDNSRISSEQYMGKYSSKINRYMHEKIDSELVKINSRQSRVNKIHWMIKNKDITIASQMAQSSISTILKHYTGESKNSSAEQLTNYFNKLNKNLFDTTQDDIDIAVGQCTKYDNPKTSFNINGIQTDCKQSYGCLFCEQYRTHIDELDMKKLLSLSFIINESKYIAKNEKHFSNTLVPILERIDSIFNQMVCIDIKNKNIIEKVKKDVFENENLHPYWEHKYNMLIQIGLLK